MKRYMQTIGYDSDMSEWVAGDWVKYEDAEKLIDFVRFIATDYIELSHDKVRWQRDDYIKRARKLLEEIYDDED